MNPVFGGHEVDMTVSKLQDFLDLYEHRRQFGANDSLIDYLSFRTAGFSEQESMIAAIHLHKVLKGESNG